VALLPLAATGDDSYVRYSTSAAPNGAGLAAAKVTAPGVQKLTIAPANALLLFNIAISIE
jgi:hypothetical protein